MTQTQLDNRLIATDIQERLIKQPSFINYIQNDDIYAAQVSRYKQVNVPQAGALPEVAIDNTENLSLTNSTDTHTSYSIHSYRTKPILVRNFDDYFTDYEKQQSITSEQATQLKEAFGKHAMQLWAAQATKSGVASGRRLRSTGSNRTASIGSGNRKGFTFNDLLGVRQQLSKDGGDRSAGNYIGLINSEMYSDLLKLPEVRQSYHKLTSSTMAGAVAEFMGFTLFLRDDLPRFNNGNSNATLLDIDDTTLGTSSMASLFFHKSMVRRAISSAVSVFVEVSASHAGVELSTEMFAGATLARTDARGCVMLIESA